jgi:Asp-tRNA(Asn)/Glu-tRNA(Gln) amidotransferase A subunit family amidase
LSYLDELEGHIEAREPDVLALVPEEGRFDRLRREAQSLLDAYPNSESRPRLFGVPVGVKDIFHADGFPTHAGSKLPPERLAGPEATSVTQLIEAGALILGKTVTTEFAYFGPGPTRNPHNPEHTPGGSSSGSAAAVAAGLCPLALGTQTIGSVTRPAAFCGVVGYKPSYERISREGVIPLSQSVDHIGFFTTGVAGVELVASVLVADWQPATPKRQPVLGVPEGPYLDHASPDGLAHFRATIERLVGAGYAVKSVPAMPDFEAITDRHNRIVAHDAAQVHADWFKEFGELYHPKTAVLIQHGFFLEAEADDGLAKAMQGREQLRQILLTLMDEHKLDLWISPSAPGPAPEGLDSTGDPVMNLPWTHGGLPTMGLPSGFNEVGLPLGLQIAGRWQGDEALVAWALDIERALAQE